MFFNNKRQQQETQKTIMQASIFSFILGVLFAIFTSPVKGSHVRKIIKNKFDDTIQNLEEKVSNSADYIKDKAENFKDTADQNLHNAKDSLEEGVNDTRSKIADKIKPGK